MIEVVLCIFLFAWVLVSAAQLYFDYRRHHRPQLTTPYQSITLHNGETYYGRIAHLGTDHPVLRDAMRVRADPASSGNATLKPEWIADERDGADHLIFPAEAILYVNPVNPNSQTGRAIAQSVEERRKARIRP